MKNSIREWLGISNDKYLLYVELIQLKNELADKDANLSALDDELQDLRNDMQDLIYIKDEIQETLDTIIDKLNK
tara:strand:+ start:1199 stop:1420 length:222 start_codon:yes stop_codon:yes gene_type:complete